MAPKNKKQKKEKYVYTLLIIILIIGAGLRLYNLGKESIWTDEAVTLTEAEKETIPLITEEVVNGEAMPPGYPVIMHYWISFFGNSEFSIRFISAIFGVASIYIMFLLGSLLFDKKLGLLTALLVSTEMLQVLYSQEARMYSLFGFLALLSTYLFFKIINKKQTKSNTFIKKNKYELGYIAITAIALYINYMALFFILFQSFMLFFFNYRKLIKKWIVLQSTIFVLFIPLTPILFKQLFLRNEALKSALPAFGIPSFLANLGIVFFALPMLTSTAFIVLLFLFRKKFRSLKIGSKANILGSLFFILIGIVYILSLSKITRSFSLIRHSYFLVPILYIWLAKIITSLKNKRLQLFVILVILFFNSYSLGVYYSKTTKPDWNSTADYISENTATTPSIIFGRGGTNIQIFTYYYGNNFKKIDIPLDENGNINNELLFASFSKEKDIWFISSRDKEQGISLKQAINSKYTPDSTAEFYLIEIFHYLIAEE